MSGRQKRNPPPLRSLPKQYPTGSAEREANAANRYFVDIGGPRDAGGQIEFSTAHFGIRDRTTNTFDARKGMTRSAVYSEVERLNAGLPVSPVSQGLGRKPRRATAATRWVELLMDLPDRAAILQNAIDTGRKLSHDDVRNLMTFPGIEWLQLPTDKSPPPQPRTNAQIQTLKQKKQRDAETVAAKKAWRARAKAAERKLVDSVSKQLERILGIGRKDAGRRNEARRMKNKITRTT